MGSRDGGSAFHATFKPYNEKVGKFEWDHVGVTVRDYFAGLALQGWLASFSNDSPFPPEKYRAEIAEGCYAMADAMLAERAKFQPDPILDAASNLLTALKHEHGCATVQADGTCEGCPVSAAIKAAEAAGVQG